MRTGCFAWLYRFQPAICGWLVALWLLPILVCLAPAPGAAAHAFELGQIRCSHHIGSPLPEKNRQQNERCPCCVLCSVGCATCNPVVHSADQLAVGSWFETQPVAVLAATAAHVANIIWLDDKPPRGPPFPLAI